MEPELKVEDSQEKPPPKIDNVKHFGIICEPGTMAAVGADLTEEENGYVQ